MRFTTLPFLLALIVAIANTPTDIYQICAWNHGTEQTEPWRAKSSDAPILRGLSAALSRFRTWCRDIGPLPNLASQTGNISMNLLVPGGSRIAAFRQRGTLIQAEIDALGDALNARGVTGVFTEDERKKLDALKSAKTQNIELLTEAETTERNAPAVADPDADAGKKAAQIVMGKDLSADDPKRGFKDSKEYLTAVMNAGRGGRVDQRLLPLRATQGSDEQGVYSDPAGGFLVPHGVAPGILSIAPEDDVVQPLLTNVPMSAPTVSYNARVDKNHATSVSGGFQVTRHPETVDGTPTRMTFEQVTLTANEEFGLAVATERIITDSPASFVAIIQAGMKDEYVANSMNERINGTGAGERQGALNTPCKIAVTKETGQKAATIVKENIDNMAARCWRYGKAIWLANQNTRPSLKSLVQVVGVGGNSVPYFVTDGAPAGFDGLLDGRPLVFTEFAKTLGTEGDLILMMPSQYLEGTYQSEQYAESIHVRFASAERMFRFYRRNDGQWWWRSALTPKNGSTLSPVVTLATRS